jgi:hypothetical protein
MVFPVPARWAWPWLACTALWLLAGLRGGAARLIKISMEHDSESGGGGGGAVPMFQADSGDLWDPALLARHRAALADTCALQRMGCSTSRCVAMGTDYLLSFLRREGGPEPCHGAALRRCLAQPPPPGLSPGDTTATTTTTTTATAPDVSGLSIDQPALLRMERRALLRSLALPAPAACSLQAALRCSLNVTLLVDLDCGDGQGQGQGLGRLAPAAGDQDAYKYMCVSGSPELGADNAAFFRSPRAEFVLADIRSPALFRDVRRASRLWAEGDVVAVVARHRLEFLPYAASLALLARLAASGAAHWVGSSSVAAAEYNPVSLPSPAGHTPLNMQRYPFDLGHTLHKWGEAGGASALTEVWGLGRGGHVPPAYPHYWDELVCGRGAAPEAVRLYGPGCDRLDASSPAHWALFAHRAQGSAYSQGGQDGALQYIFEHIGTTDKSFVEFGFNGDTYEQDTGANTHLLHARGWRGLLLDGAHSNAALNLHETWISPDTIVSVFDSHAVPLEADYLSIDIDSTELWVFRAILASGTYRPRVVSVEYNCNYPLESTLCLVGGGYRWASDRIYGTALLPLKLVADEFGYSLVNVVSHLDAIFVRSDLLRGSAVPPFESWRPFTSRPHHAERRGRADIARYLVDYSAWASNGHDMAGAQGEIVFEQIDRLGIDI